MNSILDVFDEVMALSVDIVMAILACLAYVFIAALSPLWIIPYVVYKVYKKAARKAWQEKQYKLGQEILQG